MHLQHFRSGARRRATPALCLALVAIAAQAGAVPALAAHPHATMQQVLAASRPSDWRSLDPAQTLVMTLPQGRVVIELAAQFAPRHVANIEALARAHFFDGLTINRVQDDFVTQWGDADSDLPAKARPLPADARAAMPDEYQRSAVGLDFTRLPDGDVYAPQVGFADGFPVGRDPRTDTAWLLHCYGMVGVGRDNPPDNGSGAELYAVIGQAPRQLDRNITVVGRVVAGMHLLAALPRGGGNLGFYRDPAHRTRILGVRLASELPRAERPRLEVLRTGTATFAALIAARRDRSESWFVRPAGRISVCNVPLPVRVAPAPKP
ncbi:MAG: peptidylprolyl isomerase [Xanthomonadaceae bacterium]|nr:peptidylprolyl isomerase [Xanthomonadaceae bacterium]